MKDRPILVEIMIWCAILTFIFTIGIFSYSQVFIEPNIYDIEFKDIDGITKGSPVRFMGINVGYVRKLELNEKHVNVQILVTAKNVKIPNGTIARVEFYGLGGSKSIELMPAEAEVGNFGIVTTKTLRLHDIAMKTEDLVDIIEIVERLVKGINKSATKNTLEKISDIKEDKIQSVNSDMSDFKQDFVKKSRSLREKQADVNDKINSMNENVDKINKFIKK